MDFWSSPIDPTEAASTPAEAPVQQQTLNDEVTEVMGSLNKFWGGFRRQSQAAFEIARKDLGDYATQAQQQAAQIASQAQTQAQQLAAQAQEQAANIASQAQHELNRSLGSPTTETAPDNNPDSTASSSSTLPAEPTSPTSTNLFARLQSSLPPHLVQTLQSNLPESIRHAPEQLNLTQLRSTLQQVRITDATSRGEELLHRAGDFLTNAVRVVPPSPSDAAPSSTAQGKAREAAIGTRKDALMRALRTNPAILKVDPCAEKNSEALFRSWEDKEVESVEGGILGTEWNDRRAAELKDAGEDLLGTRDTLVPSEMDEETFWTRYFFRAYQIAQDEERRKALLAGSASNDTEDFSWEDEEDSSSAPSSPTDTLRDRATSVSTDQANKSTPVAKSVNLTASASNSPPQSEASYDIVSSRVSNASESAPPAAKAPPKAKVEAAKAKNQENEEDEGEDDSEEEDDDEEEEEEGSEESDWE
ncbi:hypothetical protein PENSPDRAFT_654499 [Peniophora sp. CONT]|nr:hypothetical protein PENSPDRAFT_654499 [Peniophora sp. CONT]